MEKKVKMVMHDMKNRCIMMSVLSYVLTNFTVLYATASATLSLKRSIREGMVAVQPRYRPTSALGNETRPRPRNQPRARASAVARAPAGSKKTRRGGAAELVCWRAGDGSPHLWARADAPKVDVRAVV